jgi:hypothetical protein
MDSTGNYDINLANSSRPPPKPFVAIGRNMVLILDRSIVKELGITEGSTLVQPEVTEQGILLRIKRQTKVEDDTKNE